MPLSAVTRARLYYFAVLLSSIGSLTFTISLVVFLAAGGPGAAFVGALIGAVRLAPIFVNLVFGDIGDHAPARRVVLLSELIAAILTLAMLATWRAGEQAFIWFAALCVLRGAVAATQQGSRAKISKLLSDGTFKSDSRHAMLLNKMTQGATIFAALAGWLVYRYGSLETAILIDATTFLIGGLVILLIPKSVDTISTPVNRGRGLITDKFANLYHFAPRAARLDLLLAFVSCGAAMFAGRLAASEPIWAAAIMGVYGAAVWVGGTIEAGIGRYIPESVAWLLLGATLFGATLLSETNLVWTVAVIFIKDIVKWILFHRYSAEIQHKIPAQRIASAYSTRMFQISAVAAAGEMLVGWASTWLPLTYDGLLRGGVCAVVALYLFASRTRSEQNYESVPKAS
jgi:hypothetical protein